MNKQDDFERNEDDEEFSKGGSRIYRHNYNENRPLIIPPTLLSEEDKASVTSGLESLFGKSMAVYHEIISDTIHVDVAVYPPNDKRDFYVLATIGMSAIEMNIPEELKDHGFERAELLLAMPLDFKEFIERYNGIDNDEDIFGYGFAIPLLRNLSRMPFEYNTWLGWGHSIPNNDYETFSKYSPLMSTLLGWDTILGESNLIPLPNGQNVNLYCAFLMTAPEMQYKLDNGAEEIFNRYQEDFDKNPLDKMFCGVINLYRSSIVERDTLIDEDIDYYGMDIVELYNDYEESDNNFEKYSRMVEEGKLEGYTPIIIIDEDNVSDMQGIIEEQYGSIEDFTEHVLRESKTIDAVQFLDELSRSEQFEDFDYNEDELDEDAEEGINLYMGTDDIIKIAKVPTEKPYEVFAYIPMGGFNECPTNEFHTAIAREWYEKYGAIPCAIGSDIIEYFLQEPITDEEAAKEIALQMFYMCPNLVWQGVGSVKNLQKSIINSHFWYFWWD